MHKLDCKCETCYDDLEATNEKIAADNAYLIRIMQNIRNATDSQQQQSLLDLREELEQYRWISVSERLPEYIPNTELSRDIFILDGGCVHVGNYAECAFEYWSGSFRNVTDKPDSQKLITHWKPIILPK